MRPRFVNRFLVVAWALLGGALPAGAQGFGGAVRVAAGTALPGGGVSERQAAGPTALLSLELFGNRGRVRGGVRIDAEWTRFDGRREQRDLEVRGASLTALIGANGRLVVPYALVGLGLYRLQRVGDEPNVYGTTGAGQLGLGVEIAAWDRFRPFVEGKLHLHLTDYGAGDFEWVYYRPLFVGLRVRVLRSGPGG
jgi:hypothetical protein